MFIEYIGPLFVLAYCYGRILWVLTQRVNSKLDSKGANSDQFLLAKRNTIKTFLLVSIAFVICWTNIQVYVLLFYFGVQLEFDSVLDRVNILLVFCNCTINPFIYLFKYKDYQTALKSFFNCSKHRDVHETMTTTTTNSVTSTTRP